MDLKDRKMKGRILLLIATLSGAAIMTVSTAQAAPGKGRANIYKKGWLKGAWNYQTTYYLDEVVEE